MPIDVESAAGHRGEPEPVAFRLGARRLVVASDLDRWYGATQRWFRVTADDGDAYVLRDDAPGGEWELAACSSRRSPGTAP